MDLILYKDERIRGLIPLTNPETGEEVGSSVRQTKSSSRVASNEVSPRSGPINQAPHVLKPRIWIPNIYMVIAKLSSEAAGKIRLKISVIAASVHQEDLMLTNHLKVPNPREVRLSLPSLNFPSHSVPGIQGKQRKRLYKSL